MSYLVGLNATRKTSQQFKNNRRGDEKSHKKEFR
jgi:hypothetical protein